VKEGCDGLWICAVRLRGWACVVFSANRALSAPPVGPPNHEADTGVLGFSRGAIQAGNVWGAPVGGIFGPQPPKVVWGPLGAPSGDALST
jgi:hypothetical protein